MEGRNRSGFRWETRKCIDCGKEYIAKSPRALRCLDCRIIRERQLQRECERRRYAREKAQMREKPKVKPKAKPKVDESNICKRIKSCYYGGKMGAEHICNYLEITGVRRPCKAGECVMYKRKGKVKGGEADET